MKVLLGAQLILALVAAARWSTLITESITATAIDSQGNVVVAQSTQLLKMDGSSGQLISILAGSNISGTRDGSRENSLFTKITAIAIDSNQNILALDSNSLRSISPNGTVSTLYGGISPGSSDGIQASFNEPSCICVGSDLSIYIGELAGARVRKISAGSVSTILSLNTQNNFSNGVAGIAVDSNLNLYITTPFTHQIRKITQSGVISILAGSSKQGSSDGQYQNSSLTLPMGITFNGAILAIADMGTDSIRGLSLNGDLNTNQGGLSAFQSPTLITSDIFGNVIVVDHAGSRISKFAPNLSGILTTYSSITLPSTLQLASSLPRSLNTMPNTSPTNTLLQPSITPTTVSKAKALRVNMLIFAIWACLIAI